MEEEPETSECRATPFRSTKFYEKSLEIDAWEQLDPDPIPRPPILVPRNRIQVLQPAVGQEDGAINNPIVEQSADQLGDQAAPDTNSRENDPEPKDNWFKGSWNLTASGRVDHQTQRLNKQHDRLTKIQWKNPLSYATWQGTEHRSYDWESINKHFFLVYLNFLPGSFSLAFYESQY